mgnify:CR=1 FL=1
MPVRDTERLDAGFIGSGYTALGVFDTRAKAEQAIAKVRELGWSDEAISAVYREEGEAQPDRAVEDTGSAESAARGAAIGGVAGGLITGAAALLIPGVGVLLAAGPIVAALGGAALGGSWGGLIGSIVGMSVPDEHAREYEEAVRLGGILVSVRSRDEADANRVCQAFRSVGARAVNSYQSKA